VERLKWLAFKGAGVGLSLINILGPYSNNSQSERGVSEYIKNEQASFFYVLGYPPTIEEFVKTRLSLT